VGRRLLGILFVMRRPLCRWKLAVLAVLIQLCLGAGYSWTVFRKPLESAYGWSYAETAEPFRFLLLFYAIGMTLGGWLQDRFGPRPVAMLGGLLVSLGCAFGAVFGSTQAGMAAGYATFCGFGMGFAYVSALAVLVKWFPDRRGFIVGVAVFGFGAGSMVSAPVQTKLVGSDPAQYARTLPITFWWMAAVFFILVVGLSSFLSNPDAAHGSSTVGKGAEIPPAAALRTWAFYAQWLVMLCSTAIGLSCLSEAAPYLKRLLEGDVGFGVGLMGLANGLGRVVAGMASDRIGRKPALVGVFAIYIFTCGALLPSPSSLVQGLAGMVLAAFAFGAGIACMPALCSDFFGSKHLGANYGLVFTAFATSGFFAPAVVSTVVQNDPEAGYRAVFAVFSGMALVGATVSALLRKPILEKHAESEA